VLVASLDDLGQLAGPVVRSPFAVFDSKLLEDGLLVVGDKYAGNDQRAEIIALAGLISADVPRRSGK
jgi:hypothetical protein